jgi:predicted ATPase
VGQVFVTGVPRLDIGTLPQARRLITLVDALYAHRVKCVFSAAAVPTEIFDSSEVSSVRHADATPRALHGYGCGWR